MAGYFRMEVKVVSRTSLRTNGSVGTNSALQAAAYISAEEYQQYNMDATQAAAYISGEKIHSQKTNMHSDYTNKKGVMDSWVMLPPNAPKEYFNPEVLWNAVEQNETGKNASLFREWIISFEKHLTEEQRYKVAQEFAQSLVDEGMAVHIALHDEKDGNGNFHMHILAPMRGFDEAGEWDEYKTYPRGYLLDENGERIPMIDKKTGLQKVDSHGRKQWKRAPIEYVRDFNNKKLDNVTRWRKTFAEIENRYLPTEFQVSPDSYIKQGIDKVPGKHLGKTAYNVHKKLEAQVNGLTFEKRQEYLQRILEQVQHDYRKLYYNNSRGLIDMHLDDESRKALQKEIMKDLQLSNKYKPKKEFIAKIGYKPINRIKLEKAFLDILTLRNYQYQQYNQEEVVQDSLYLMEKMLEAENDLIIMFTNGMTASMENRLYIGTYDIQKEVIRQLGAEIRELEKQIKELAEEEIIADETESLEEQLNKYRERIKSIREGQFTFDYEGAGPIDNGPGKRNSESYGTAIDCAEQIARFAEELQGSIGRLGSASKSVAETDRRVFGHRQGESIETMRKAKKANRRKQYYY